MFCPKCNAEMEDDYVDLDSMTEGQVADYQAGFHDVRCPKCGYEAETHDSPL